MSIETSPKAASETAAGGFLKNQQIDIGVLVRRWPLIAAGLLIGVGLALAYQFTATTKYESKAQILVMKKDSTLPTHGGERSTENAEKVSEDMLASHMQIVQSPKIVDNALRQAQLENLPSVVSRLKEDQSEAEYIIDNLAVSRGGAGQAKLANVLNVAFRHTSSEDCEKVMNAIVASYKGFLADTFQDVSKDAVNLIAEARDEIGKDLESVEADYQQFREQAPLLWNGDSTSNTHRLNFERIQQSISDLQMQRATAKTRLETVTQGIARQGDKASDLDLLALIDQDHVARLTLLVTVKQGSSLTEEFGAKVPGITAKVTAEYQGLLALALKEKTLLADFGSEHPLVQDVRQQLSETQSFIDRKSAGLSIDEQRTKLDPNSLLAGYVTLLKNDLDTLNLREKEMEMLAAQEEQAAKELVSSELRGEALKKEVDRKQQLYDTVLDRLREINLIKDYGGLVTEVIAPVEPGEKVWPKLPLVLLMGILAGLVLGAGAAFGAEFLDRSLRSEEEVRQALNLPVLTRLPRFKGADVELKDLDPDALDPTLVAYYRPKSREAEAFRGLRTSLFFSSRGRRQQIIMGTSANPGDGKTLMSSNLAVSIAQSGRKVLLIDADMRRPRIHKLFGLSVETGLSSVIGGEIDPPDAVQATPVENLWCVTCGPAPANPSELLSSAQFEQCLQFYREHYDYIIIDCPPLLAVADPCIVAPIADAVIFAVRLIKDTQSQIQRSKELLESVDANVIGVVVNGADHKGEGRYGYGYGYGYGGYGGYGNYGTYGYSANSNGYFDEEDANPNSNPADEQANAARRHKSGKNGAS